MKYYFYTGSIQSKCTTDIYIRSNVLSTELDYFPFNVAYDEYRTQDVRFTIMDWKLISEEEFKAYINRHNPVEY
jgi:hypothetical protein